MTRETVVSVTLNEIAAVRWQCHHCGVKVSYKLSESFGLPVACPSCRGDAGPSGTGAAGAFVKALKGTLETPLEHATLSLELKQN